MNGHESESRRSETQSPSALMDDSFSFYETVLNLTQAMGRLEERSTEQGEKITKVADNLEKVSEKLEQVSRYIYGAKVGLWIIGSIIGLTAGVLSWLIHSTLTVLRILVSSP